MKNSQEKSMAYEIKTKTERRVTHFENGVGVWEEYPRYDITLDGEIVQFCFNKEDIEPTIDFLENGDGIDPAYFTGLTAG
jgi:hypothetical protein